MTGLQLRETGVGDEQIGHPGAPPASGFVQSIQGGFHRQHLRNGVDHQAGQVELLIGQAMGEADLGEAVRQGGVGAPRPGQPGGVMVAADDDRGHAVSPDPGQRPLCHPVRVVGGAGVIEDVSQPDHQVWTLVQGELDRRFEGLLEVELPLVDPLGGGKRIIRAPKMGVPDGGHAHGTSKPEAWDEYQGCGLFSGCAQPGREVRGGQLP